MLTRRHPSRPASPPSVGGLGFGVDAGLLYALAGWGVGLYGARDRFVAVALTVTWALNRNWTFEQRGRAGAGRSYRGYTVVQLLGALTNFLVDKFRRMKPNADLAGCRKLIRYQAVANLARGSSVSFRPLVCVGVLNVLSPTPGNAVLALACGSAVGLIVNFTGARFLFFPRTTG